MVQNMKIFFIIFMLNIKKLLWQAMLFAGGDSWFSWHLYPPESSDKAKPSSHLIGQKTSYPLAALIQSRLTNLPLDSEFRGGQVLAIEQNVW